MQSLVDQTLGKLRTAIAAHVTSLDTQIRALDQSHGRLAAEINQLPDIEAEETQKTRQVQTLQAMVDNLRLEHQRARIQEAVQAGRVDIVDLAPRPYLPVGMGTRFKLFVGLMLGLMLGVGTAFGRELMNRSIRGREQLEEIAPVPGLAVIPRLVPASNGRLRLRPGRKERDEAVAAEAYRILNANLQVTAGDVGFRTVVVTSAVPAEGKTTTATNLARLLAEHGERVLLVDADLRVGELHKEFQVARKPGLAELLAGTAPVQGVIRETNAPGLHVIPRGTYQPDHGHALAPGRVLSILGELSSLYDSILLDTAPVLTVAEARIFAACAPAVLLVVRAGRTDRELVLRALQELESVGARVIGTVLNDSNAEIRETGAYGYAYMTSR
ncbi:MAG: polysaccharide biosynthesis tyrosine autokinase [Gemmatimonadetes bacterium]|nr:polysaccharide biosynthesis tyrosine autokinase [Gemmatimonadota bacterium]NIQ52549.1 polysaccharide biosynthesis tyrosine autokinase [Gemmatimonadota bacterium]NIU72687.1 polysaccharide biosynthesis tyrosine autokinase [Gammaproteobacteria bacterium]NIX43093.1 polysaccharide biosynthesis tyrosine autokinase [Gemmatimonadota bacterium]NIY07255.1 polysaccharide biosynthesis tyrosine autokinase [Gemmatimonadota bacterium]